MELPLPAGASGEILYDIMAICTKPPFLGAGLVIDDLRLEWSGATRVRETRGEKS
jgi:hypothetical protein